MKHIQILGVLALLACFTVSCANRRNKTANNPYQSNPYYTGSSSASSETAASAEYPTKNETPTYEANNTVEYPTYTGESNYPSYTGGSAAPVEAPAPIPVPAPTPYPTYSPPTYPTTPAAPAARSHVVASGENLYRISLKYGTSVSAIQSANGLGSSATIHPGQVLQIP